MGGLISMASITISALLMLFFSAYKITRMVIEKKFDLKCLNYILVFGSVSFIIGILKQGIGISQILQISSNEYVQDKFITKSENILSNLVPDGIRVTLIEPIYGLIIFLFSLIIWAVLKEINLRKMR